MSETKQLRVGQVEELHRVFTEEDVKQYAELSSDKNPIHLDEAYAANTQFKSRLVHGMLVGSLFSALLGQKLPGEGSIYMAQDIKFKAPVYLDMPIVASVEIIAINERKPIVTLKTQCVDGEGKVLLTGEAVMYVPWLKKSE